MYEYKDFFDEMAFDFKISPDFLIKEFDKSNRSMILRQNNVPIGILIMDDNYYEKLNEFVHFIKFLWIQVRYRGNHVGSKVVNNIMLLNNLITKNRSCIVLNVEKNYNVINFYKKLNFEQIDDNGNYIVLIKRI